MVDLRLTRAAGNLAQRAYTLQPVRSRAVRAAIWAGVWVCSGVVGAAAMYAYLQHADALASHCTSAPVTADGAQTELERSRLALEQESTARAAVQKTADVATAEVSRLNAQLMFLRGQGQKRR
ncbi:MAG: hypothetical protein WCA85_04275 [Paraburkholderia sp.]|uniref:hypothetical protein n=1 Tax=Paraburkholderia sp. TaxID=1926495 RepID=UPI003C5147D8